MLASTITTALTALLLTITTTATPIRPRAGAPAYKPITAPCHITYPLSDPSTSPPLAYRPTPNTTAAHEIYSWDRPIGDADYTNSTALWTSCIEQCNGLAGCKAAFLAYNVPGEARYGAEAGQPSIGCRMFDVVLGQVQLEGVRAGYERAVAGSLVGCGKKRFS